MRGRSFVWALVAACGGSPSKPTSVAVENPCWPIVPLRVESIEHGSQWEEVVTLEAGGRVLHKSSTVGLLESDHFKMLQGGTLHCTPELRVELNGNKTALHYDEHGALVEGSQRVHVGETGVVSFGKNGPGAAVRVRVFGAKDAATRRTAALIVFAGLM